MFSQYEPLIQQAITDARAKKEPAARSALSEVVRQDPGNARAWYLLSQVVDKPEQAIYCLEQVLKVQPENMQAKQRLQKLRPVATPAPETFEDIPIAMVPPSRTSHPTSSRKQTNWTLIIVVLGVIAITCVCFGALGTIGTGNISSPTVNVEEQIASAKQIPYEELARNTENHIGEIVTYRGKIVQVIEQSGQKMGLRVEVTEGEYGIWDDLVWVNYEGPRLLEDDVVRFWGKVEGRFSYTTVLGAQVTIPEITALKLSLEK